MPFHNRHSDRVWWRRGSPYGPFVLLALCLVAAVLVLLSVQPHRVLAPPSGARATPVPDKPVPEPSAPSPPPSRPKPTTPQPLSPPRAAPSSPVPAPSSSAAAVSPPAASPSRTASGPSIAEIEAEIIRLTNAERAAERLAPLKHDTALDAIARAHSRDMVARGFFSHENPDGDGPTERAEKAGYDVHKTVPGGELVGIGENIGMTPLGPVEDIGFVEREARSIASAQVRGWMMRRGHRSNILSEDYERIGVGVVYNGRGEYTCTQVFW